MITCPECKSSNVKSRRRHYFDPAEDTFVCLDCDHVFKRYDCAHAVEIRKRIQKGNK